MERVLGTFESLHCCIARGTDILVYVGGPEKDSSAAMYMTTEGTGNVKEISLAELMDRPASVMLWRRKGTTRFFSSAVVWRKTKFFDVQRTCHTHVFQKRRRAEILPMSQGLSLRRKENLSIKMFL